MTSHHVVLLPATLPPEVDVFLSEYLHQIGPNQFLFSRLFHTDGMFVLLDVVNASREERSWALRLPVQYVLAAAQVEDDKAKAMGFLA